jgi:hypothetical protein
MRRLLTLALITLSGCIIVIDSGPEDDPPPCPPRVDAGPPVHYPIDAGVPDAYDPGFPRGNCPADYVSCAVSDGGWQVWCQDGLVVERDLTAYLWCPPGGGIEDACSALGNPDPYARVYCPASCATSEGVYLETSQEYQEFDPTSLCAPTTVVDAGAVDARVP